MFVPEIMGKYASPMDPISVSNTGTLRAFALLGAFLALMLALSLGPTPLDLPDDVADVCEAVAWFRDTELSYTVASTENLKAWAQVPGRLFLKIWFGTTPTWRIIPVSKWLITMVNEI